jgi:hypothetical protein
LPDPEEPTKAMDWPFFILRLKFLSTFTSGFVGYANETFLN